MEFVVVKDYEDGKTTRANSFATDLYVDLLYYDEGDCKHDWQPVWSTNASARAYQCQNCGDRTD